MWDRTTGVRPAGMISCGYLIHTHTPFRTSAISVYFIVSFLLVKIFLCFTFRRKIRGRPLRGAPTLRLDHMLSCGGTDEPRSVMTFARTLRALQSYFKRSGAGLPPAAHTLQSRIPFPGGLAAGLRPLSSPYEVKPLRILGYLFGISRTYDQPLYSALFPLHCFLYTKKGFPSRETPYKSLAGVLGFEPRSTVLETVALPLNYTPMERKTRFELATPTLAR